MHSRLELAHRNEALFFGQEWMLLIGMNDFLFLGGLALGIFDCSHQGHIHQIVVMIEPDFLDYLQFHLLRLRIVSPNLLAYFECPDGLLTLYGCDRSVVRKAQPISTR